MLLNSSPVFVDCHHVVELAMNNPVIVQKLILNNKLPILFLCNLPWLKIQRALLAMANQKHEVTFEEQRNPFFILIFRLIYKISKYLWLKACKHYWQTSTRKLYRIWLWSVFLSNMYIPLLSWICAHHWQPSFENLKECFYLLVMEKWFKLLLFQPKQLYKICLYLRLIWAIILEYLLTGFFYNFIGINLVYPWLWIKILDWACRSSWLWNFPLIY
jgi:hypothetical protein